MLRMILPQLIGVVIFLGILWFIAYQFRKTFKDSTNVDAAKVAQWITLIVVVIFTISVINIASTNEIPRSVIDRTNEEKMIKNLDETSKEKASQPKQTTNNSNTKN